MFCLVVWLVSFSRRAVTYGIGLINKPTSEGSKSTPGRVSHGARIKYWSQKSTLLPIASKFDPQKANRFAQLCAQLHPPVCFISPLNVRNKEY